MRIAWGQHLTKWMVPRQRRFCLSSMKAIFRSCLRRRSVDSYAAQHMLKVSSQFAGDLAGKQIPCHSVDQAFLVAVAVIINRNKLVHRPALRLVQHCGVVPQAAASPEHTHTVRYSRLGWHSAYPWQLPQHQQRWRRS